MDADSWRQARSVLEAALLCAPAERDALIAARCADPSLRREVLACLNEHDEDFLESALTISHTFEHATSTDDVEAPPDVQIGERIGRNGRYEVIGRLGAGGMGQVFLCNDADLRRKVALKFLIASASAADVKSRILHEARVAQISHPNIAVVHDVDEHEGRPFLVMEYVEGGNLAQALKRERPPLERILAVGRQLASGLTAAHAKGIIHRDLKPANIQVMPDWSVKILDFGVAHAMALADMESAGATTVSPAPLSTTMATLRTERGSIRHPGTPGYMSPEQMLGKPIDQRSDIFSLGVILYEMSTGHRPYSTEDPLDVVLALSRNLLRPSGTETHLPDAVNDVIGKMLAVELDQRYQTALEVETALVALSAPEPGSSTLARPSARSRVLVAAKIAVFIVALPAAIGTLGYLETVAFNFALGRVAPFDEEPPIVWLKSGGSALVLPLIYQVGIFLLLAAVRFVVRMLSLSHEIDRLVTTGLTRTRYLSVRLGLNNPTVLAQAVAMVGFIALAGLTAAFWNVIRAWMVNINTAPSEQWLPLRPGNRTAYQVFHFLLCVLVLAFSIAVFRIGRLRATQRVRSSAASFSLVVGMLTFSIVMLILPHRIAWKAQFERVDVGNDRCFILGEHDTRMQVFCPERVPPRNRTIGPNDPPPKRLGIAQSIFSTPETPR
jgi:tRNA A-37 threonylcarbamoyl transferase component Bud32